MDCPLNPNGGVPKFLKYPFLVFFFSLKKKRLQGFNKVFKNWITDK